MDSRSSRRSSRRQLNPYTVHGLSVTEVRKELEVRGLDSTGTKNKLAERLSDFILLGDSPEKSASTPVTTKPTPARPKPKSVRKEPAAKRSKSTPTSSSPEPPLTLGSIKDKYRQRRRIAAGAENVNQAPELKDEDIPANETELPDSKSESVSDTVTSTEVTINEEVERPEICETPEPVAYEETASTHPDDQEEEEEIIAYGVPIDEATVAEPSPVPSKGSEAAVEDFIEETVEIEFVPPPLEEKKPKKRGRKKKSESKVVETMPDVEPRRRSSSKKRSKSRHSTDRKSSSPVGSVTSDDSKSHSSKIEKETAAKPNRKRRASQEPPEDILKSARRIVQKASHSKLKKTEAEKKEPVPSTSSFLMGAVDKSLKFLSEKLSKRQKTTEDSEKKTTSADPESNVEVPLTVASTSTATVTVAAATISKGSNNSQVSKDAVSSEKIPRSKDAVASETISKSKDAVSSEKISKSKDTVSSEKLSKPKDTVSSEKNSKWKEKEPSPSAIEKDKPRKQLEPRQATPSTASSDKSKRAPSPLSLLLGIDISLDPAKSAQSSPREASVSRDSPRSDTEVRDTVPQRFVPRAFMPAGPPPIVEPLPLLNLQPPPPPPPPPQPAKSQPFSSLEARIRELGIAPPEPEPAEPDTDFWKERAAEWAKQISSIIPSASESTAEIQPSSEMDTSLQQISSSESDILDPEPTATTSQREVTIDAQSVNATFETVSSAELDSTVEEETGVVDVSLTEIPLPDDEPSDSLREDSANNDTNAERPRSAASSSSSSGSSRSSRSTSRSSSRSSRSRSRSHSTSPSRSSGEDDEADLPEPASTGKKGEKESGEKVEGEEEEEDEETDSDEEAERAEAAALAEEQRRQKLLREAKQAEEKKKLEDVEYPIDESLVQLDYYNADLHMRVLDHDGLSAEPVTQDGFALAWAGIKASFGVSKGKVGFQVKITHEMDITHITSDETFPHEIRIGWSLKEAPLLLGEGLGSYAYSNTARRAQNGLFSMWGQSFNKDDVISCCFNFDEKRIWYWKNEEALGAAFTIGGNDVECMDEIGPAYFPHVATKNCRFEINFGKKEWIPLPEGYTFINEIPREDRTRNYEGPKEKSECMVIMMVGLPAAGKSRWVQKYLRDFQGERWEVISSDAVVELMKVNGIARYKCHKGRWDVVMGLASKAANKQLALACRKRKNFILDMTNVMSMTRKRKMAPFKEFGKKAVVIVPSEEEHANRRLRQAQELGREIPAEAMLELKACFTLPTLEEGGFDDIIYAEEDEERARKIVERYNEEGKSWKPPERTRMGGRMSHGGQFRRRGAGHEEFDGNRGKLSEQEKEARAARAEAKNRASQPPSAEGSPPTEVNSGSPTEEPQQSGANVNLSENEAAGVSVENGLDTSDAAEEETPESAPNMEESEEPESRLAQPLLDEVVPLAEP